MAALLMLLLLLCLPAAANFYMVVSQDVVTVAVVYMYLKWSDACVGALIVPSCCQVCITVVCQVASCTANPQVCQHGFAS